MSDGFEATCATAGVLNTFFFFFSCFLAVAEIFAQAQGTRALFLLSVFSSAAHCAVPLLLSVGCVALGAFICDGNLIIFFSFFLLSLVLLPQSTTNDYFGFALVVRLL